MRLEINAFFNLIASFEFSRITFKTLRYGCALTRYVDDAKASAIGA